MQHLTETTYLVLTRKPSQRIFIGDNMTITVLGIRGYQVRIGIHAPKDIAIWREEVWERQQQELGVLP